MFDHFLSSNKSHNLFSFLNKMPTITFKFLVDALTIVCTNLYSSQNHESLKTILRKF